MENGKLLLIWNYDLVLFQSICATIERFRMVTMILSAMEIEVLVLNFKGNFCNPVKEV